MDPCYYRGMENSQKVGGTNPPQKSTVIFRGVVNTRLLSIEPSPEDAVRMHERRQEELERAFFGEGVKDA